VHSWAVDMYPFFRSVLFRLEPEKAHTLTLCLIRLASALPGVREGLKAFFSAPAQPVQAFGLIFRNPVGLAAGYDKDGLSWRGLACLGFSHIEVGTVTVRPQPGNPKPRLFRLEEERGLINRLGFPGKGVDFVARRLKGKRPAGLVLGVNLGKNKDTPLEEAAEDYLTLLQAFAPLGDYLAINVSSPNTVGLRRLQARYSLHGLLGALSVERSQQETLLGKHIPLLVKLAPDLTDVELDDALDVIESTGMDGVIATNTTIRRTGVASSLAKETGGLSGVPLNQASTLMIRKICQYTGGKLPVIGVGGIDGPVSAREKLEAGACLIQVYTGLVYQGPSLVRDILMNM
jgi:dihydroorotate dehydrogenase